MWVCLGFGDAVCFSLSLCVWFDVCVGFGFSVFCCFWMGCVDTLVHLPCFDCGNVCLVVLLSGLVCDVFALGGLCCMLCCERWFGVACCMVCFDYCLLPYGFGFTSCTGDGYVWAVYSFIVSFGYCGVAVLRVGLI